jgi:hypothetical protein
MEMNIKNLIVEAVKHKDEVNAILQSLNYEDLEQGRFVIQSSLVTTDLRPYILANTKAFLVGYHVDFLDNAIYLRAEVNAKQLGVIDLRYKIIIQELRFDDSGHKLFATFDENVNSLGNFAQKLAVKAALVNGPLLKTALKMGSAPYIFVDGKNLLLDFDQLDFVRSLPVGHQITYINAKDSKLTLFFA